MNVRRAVIVAVAVIVVLAAALAYVRAENERYHVDPEPSEVGLTVGTQLSEDGFPDESSRLWVYGNADGDDDVDEDDMRYLMGVLSGENPVTVLSDANCDGVVDEDDLWLWGMFYNNPGDRHLFINDRTGSGMGVNIGIGLVLSFSYIWFTTITSTFAVSGYTSPFVAMWIPNVLYTVIAIYLYRKASI